jgi:histone deacetylase HOS3
MKKIKINLITKAQREARERAAQNGDQSAQSSTEPENPLDLPTPIETSSSVDAMSMETSASPEYYSDISPTQVVPSSEFALPILSELLPGGVSTPVQGHYPSPALSPDARQAPLPSSSPSISPTPMNHSTPDMFVPYQPEGPAPISVAQHEPLKWLPPNTSTPTPSPMKRANLPVFTATSAIPFASPQKQELQRHAELAIVKTEQDDAASSVWDVPYSPRK